MEITAICQSKFYLRLEFTLANEKWVVWSLAIRNFQFDKLNSTHDEADGLVH